MPISLTAEVREFVGHVSHSIWQMAWSGFLFLLAVTVMTALICWVLWRVLDQLGFDFDRVGAWFLSLMCFIAFLFYEYTPWGFYLGSNFADGWNSAF